VTDALLCAAVKEMEKGLIDASLGGGVVKKRIAVPAEQSGGARTLVARITSNVVLCVCFEKNARQYHDNELEALQDIAADLLTLTLTVK